MGVYGRGGNIPRLEERAEDTGPRSRPSVVVVLASVSRRHVARAASGRRLSRLLRAYTYPRPMENAVVRPRIIYTCPYIDRRYRARAVVRFSRDCPRARASVREKGRRVCVHRDKGRSWRRESKDQQRARVARRARIQTAARSSSRVRVLNKLLTSRAKDHFRDLFFSPPPTPPFSFRLTVHRARKSPPTGSSPIRGQSAALL